MGKLIPSLEADLAARKKNDAEKEAKRKKRELVGKGGEYLGDDDDLLYGGYNDREGVKDEPSADAEDSSIPSPVAWQMYKRWKGYRSDEDMADERDCVVYRDWRIFLYMLARGLLNSYSL